VSIPLPAAEEGLLWQEPDLRELVIILEHRKWWVANVFLAILAITVLFTYWTRPVYRASAIVQVAGPAFVSLGSPQTQGTGPVLVPESTSVDTMAELMKRPEVLRRAVSIAGLDTDVTGTGWLSVRRVGATNLIGIDVDSTDPLRASALADAIAQATVEVNLQGRRRHFTDVREYIEAQLSDTSRRLHDVEGSIARFRSKDRSVALSQETAADIQRLSELQSQRLAIQLDIRNLREDMRQDPMALMLRSSPAQGSPVSGTDIPIVKMLRDQMANLKVELAGLRSQFTDKYPAVKDAEARLQQIQAVLRQEGSDEVASLNAQLRVMEAKDRVLDDAIHQLQNRIEAVPLRELELERLTRDQKVEEGNYLFLAQKLEEARIAETSVGSEVQLVSPAVTPRRPVKPNKPLNTAVGCIMGLFLGVGTALVVEHFDDTLKNRDDIERILGLPVLGVVPSVRRVERVD
jgi:succinoglycan biosynthesis transport protein ExoP